MFGYSRGGERPRCDIIGGGLSLWTISPHGGEERPTAGYRNAAIISDKYETAVNCAKHGSAP